MMGSRHDTTGPGEVMDPGGRQCPASASAKATAGVRLSGRVEIGADEAGCELHILDDLGQMEAWLMRLAAPHRLFSDSSSLRARQISAALKAA
jgi:hypothetical protein